MRVIGTAGHVDHGKSTLVKCLTGIDPDRLAEEKIREMTIDLGFAWLSLPDGELLGIVDVPGHRDFIGNMLAGIGSIDAVLLVIAADEGMMPQTREHLAILNLLGIQHGLIVLTKSDLVSDPEWLVLIKSDISAQIAKTSLANAEMIPVSAFTGEGIPYLLNRIAALAPLLHSITGLPHLAIDRVFTMRGFGTVVTGTLLGASLHIGDTISIQPMGLTTRIRGLQSYNQAVEVAYPGSRVAVNLTGIDRHAVKRGDVLTYPGQLDSTDRVDVHFRHLSTVDRPLKHNAQVKIFVGTAESNARVRLLNDDALLPGSQGWLQLQLDQPLAIAKRDRYILRYPSPAQTIGGGVIVDAHPAKRWRRFQPEVIASLETRLTGTPAEQLAQLALMPSKPTALLKQLAYPESDFASILAAAHRQNLIIEFSDGSILSSGVWQSIRSRITNDLQQYHLTNPLHLGMSREELRNRLGITQAVLTLYLEQLPDIIAEKDRLRFHDHQVHFDYAQKTLIDQLMLVMQNSISISLEEAAALVGVDVLHALIELGDIVQLSPTVIVTTPVYADIVSIVLETIDAHDSITVAALRDQLDTSRKVAVALLEHLDSLGVTRRQGDIRVRR